MKNQYSNDELSAISQQELDDHIHDQVKHSLDQLVDGLPQATNSRLEQIRKISLTNTTSQGIKIEQNTHQSLSPLMYMKQSLIPQSWAVLASVVVVSALVFTLFSQSSGSKPELKHSKQEAKKLELKGKLQNEIHIVEHIDNSDNQAQTSDQQNNNQQETMISNNDNLVDDKLEKENPSNIKIHPEEDDVLPNENIDVFDWLAIHYG